MAPGKPTRLHIVSGAAPCRLPSRANLCVGPSLGRSKEGLSQHVYDKGRLEKLPEDRRPVGLHEDPCQN